MSRHSSLRGFASKAALAGREGRGQLDLLRLAWTNTGRKARELFLAEVMTELCRSSTNNHWRRSVRPGATQGELVSNFLAANIVHAPNHKIQATKLLARFNAWAEAAGAPPWSSRHLADQMKLRGFESYRSHFAWWIDIRLTEQAAVPPAPPQAKSATRKPSRE